MKPLKLAALALAGAAGVGACTDLTPTTPLPSAAPSHSAASAPARSLVVFKRDAIPADFAARVAALGGTVDITIPQIGVAYVSGLDAAGLAGVRGGSEVQGVEPEVTLSLVKPAGVDRMAGGADAVQSATRPDSALWYRLQWNLRQIGANQAWAAGKRGSSGVTVAIVDTGLDYAHYDLAGRVDLGRSRSFVPSEDSVVAAYLPAGTHPVYDLHGHGTHVGATVSSNGVVAAGVTSQVQLMGLKVCRSEIEGLSAGGCPTGGTFAALVYAADNGADVVNMSLGGLFTKAGQDGYASVINRVFNYLKQKNVTVVVAAGNDAADLQHGLVPDSLGVMQRYPSLYGAYCDAPHVVCVSATGPSAPAAGGSVIYGPWENIDAPAVYTNYGNAVTVAAPGGNVGGYIWAACPRRAVVKDGATYKGVVDAYCNGGYPAGMAGTSMASPHVAGLAALMVEKHGKNPTAVTGAIRRSADAVGKSGSDLFYGKGRINVARALGL